MQISPKTFALILAGFSLLGCTDAKTKRATQALDGLRGALQTPANLPRFGDSRIVQESLIFHRSSVLEQTQSLPLQESALDVMVRDVESLMIPATYWARARVYLREGKCEKLEDIPLPTELTAPTPSPTWRPAVAAQHTRLARRLNGAFAADFRCGSAPRFTAIFVRPDPDDGTLRVADIRASTRGQ
ncbi:MAG: hypothetical protein Q8Q09_12075 [Deltaproteobacteria bacterium]|nr:hypothetical protein [Deltaproteobacteria bacterium]